MKKLNINIQSILKNPTTMQEATERRDTFKALMLGCIALAILFTIIGAVISVDFFESLGMILIVTAVVFFYFWYRVKGDVQRLQNIFCVCGQKFNFSDDVFYEKKSEQLSSGKQSNSTDVVRHISTIVEICCKCQKCGKVHTFDCSFITKREVYNERGILLREKEFPLEGQLEEYFSK